MEQIPDWESLIAERSRPCATICKTDNARINNAYRKRREWGKRHPNYNAEYYAAHREQKLAENAKWKKEHKEKNREYQRNYKIRHKDDPKWHKKRKLWNREYRARKRAEKKAKEAA